MQIIQINENRVLITLKNDDISNFDLEFDKLNYSDPCQQKIIERLFTLACVNNDICTKDKTVTLEALPNPDGYYILVSLNDKKSRKRYRIKRIKEYPCYQFFNIDSMFTIIKKLYNCDALYYNNSLYCYNNRYYLVFDYPSVPKKVQSLLNEFALKVKCNKLFLARLNESAKKISSGNAIVHIGSAL